MNIDYDFLIVKIDYVRYRGLTLNWI